MNLIYCFQAQEGFMPIPATALFESIKLMVANGATMIEREAFESLSLMQNPQATLGSFRYNNRIKFGWVIRDGNSTFGYKQKAVAFIFDLDYGWALMY